MHNNKQDRMVALISRQRERGAGPCRGTCPRRRAAPPGCPQTPGGGAHPEVFLSSFSSLREGGGVVVVVQGRCPNPNKTRSSLTIFHQIRDICCFLLRVSFPEATRPLNPTNISIKTHRIKTHRISASQSPRPPGTWPRIFLRASSRLPW